MHVRPVRLLHRQPAAIRLQPPLEHERRLVLLRRDRANDVFAQPGRNRVRLDVGHEAVLVFPADQGFDRAAHKSFSVNRLRACIAPQRRRDSAGDTDGSANQIKLVGFPAGSKKRRFRTSAERRLPEPAAKEQIAEHDEQRERDDQLHAVRVTPGGVVLRRPRAVRCQRRPPGGLVVLRRHASARSSRPAEGLAG